MYAYQQLLLELDPEPADEALEELLSRVAERDTPYDGDHGYHGSADGFDDVAPVAAGPDDDQA